MANKKFYYNNKNKSNSSESGANNEGQLSQNVQKTENSNIKKPNVNGANVDNLTNPNGGQPKKKKKHKPAAKKPQTAFKPNYPDSKLKLSLLELGLTDKTMDLLGKSKVLTANDLCIRTEKDMFKIQGLNKRILVEVQNALKNQGMALRVDRTPTVMIDNKEIQNTRLDAGVVKKSLRDNKNHNNDSRNSRFDNKNNRLDNKKQPAKIHVRQEKITEPLPVADWRKIQKGGKWGFFDGMKTVIAPTYDEVYFFKEDLASVEVDEKCGYIDSENNVVIDFVYDMATSFSEGLAMVVKGGKCGYINKQNDIVIPFNFDAGTSFNDGVAKIKKDGKWGTMDANGAIIWI